MPGTRAGNEVSMRNTLQQYTLYLFKGQGIPRMFHGGSLVFYCTFVPLRGHIFAGIEKFGAPV